MEKPLIEFWTDIPYLNNIEEIRPQPSKKFVPEWWGGVPANDSSKLDYMQTVRSCPSFMDYFSQGYVIPMWADTIIYYDKDTGMYTWKCGGVGSQFSIGTFDSKQFIEYSGYAYKGSNASTIFQFISPWKIKTPKGYSVMQLPMFYWNQEFAALPGIVDSDIYPIINQEIAYFGDKSEIFIKKGTPIAQYVPFKRISPKLEIRQETEEDKEYYGKVKVELSTTFKNWYQKKRSRTQE